MEHETVSFDAIRGLCAHADERNILKIIEVKNGDEIGVESFFRELFAHGLGHLAYLLQSAAACSGDSDKANRIGEIIDKVSDDRFRVVIDGVVIHNGAPGRVNEFTLIGIYEWTKALLCVKFQAGILDDYGFKSETDVCQHFTLQLGSIIATEKGINLSWRVPEPNDCFIEAIDWSIRNRLRLANHPVIGADEIKKNDGGNLH